MFSIPIWGLTGIIDPITSNNIIHGVITLALSSGFITPAIHS